MLFGESLKICPICYKEASLYLINCNLLCPGAGLPTAHSARLAKTALLSVARQLTSAGVGRR